MRFFNKTIIVLCCIAALSGCQQDKTPTVTIGIIEPLEHTAMNEIVAGFSETLKTLYNKPVKIKIENAQNDANIQRAIIQKMRDMNYDMVVPIGVGATEMSLSMVHAQPVVSLASDLSDKDRKKQNPCHAAVVHDEISSKQLIEFIHDAYPKITQLTLIHSSADKVLPQVKETIDAGRLYGININHKMVSSLPELYSTTQALPDGTQGIFILKDSLIVSGISTLAKAAAEKNIPLITSDQGSIQDGAGFALGVHEKEIGVEGAKLAAAVLNGRRICELPIVGMKNLTVFINQKSLQQEGQSIASILKSAKRFSYNTEIIN